jgi:hypothetical protein
VDGGGYWSKEPEQILRFDFPFSELQFPVWKRHNTHLYVVR